MNVLADSVRITKKHSDSWRRLGWKWIQRSVLLLLLIQISRTTVLLLLLCRFSTSGYYLDIHIACRCCQSHVTGSLWYPRSPHTSSKLDNFLCIGFRWWMSCRSQVRSWYTYCVMLDRSKQHRQLFQVHLFRMDPKIRTYFTLIIRMYVLKCMYALKRKVYL